jgi:putative ABC transport system permease protein
MVIGSGVALGLPAGAIIAYVLVKLLTGVFDPPPDALSYPWGYLAALVVTAVGAALLAAAVAVSYSRIGVTEKLRAR